MITCCVPNTVPDASYVLFHSDLLGRDPANEKIKASGEVTCSPLHIIKSRAGI